LRAALVLIVLAFPFVEIWGVVELSRIFGVWFLLWIAFTAVLGVAIILNERSRLGPRLTAMLQKGGWSLPALLYTFRRLIAGILLLIPGVVSDVLAVILLLLPPTSEAESTRGGSEVIEGEFHAVDPANEAEEGPDRLPPK
jgi:UPF0716 protein FxsA